MRGRRRKGIGEDRRRRKERGRLIGERRGGERTERGEEVEEEWRRGGERRAGRMEGG